MGKVFVEFEPQSRIEGDVQQMPADFPVTELWEVFQNLKSGRDSNTQVTVFDSVGFALEDFSMLNYLYQLSSQYKLGGDIDLIPEFDNSKNLFDFIRHPQSLPHQLIA